MGMGGCHLLPGGHCAASHVSQDKGGGAGGGRGSGEGTDRQCFQEDGLRRAGLSWAAVAICARPLQAGLGSAQLRGPLSASARPQGCSRRSALLSQQPCSGTWTSCLWLWGLPTRPSCLNHLWVPHDLTRMPLSA